MFRQILLWIRLREMEEKSMKSKWLEIWTKHGTRVLLNTETLTKVTAELGEQEILYFTRDGDLLAEPFPDKEQRDKRYREIRSLLVTP